MHGLLQEAPQFRASRRLLPSDSAPGPEIAPLWACQRTVRADVRAPRARRARSRPQLPRERAPRSAPGPRHPGYPDIPLGAELRGLQLKIGALELWVLPDRIRRPDGGVPKCLSGRGALSKEATPLDDPAIAVGRELLFADHPTVLIALRRAHCDGIATVGACRHFMQTRAIRHALAQIRLTQHLTDI